MKNPFKHKSEDKNKKSTYPPKHATSEHVNNNKNDKPHQKIENIFPSNHMHLSN